MAANDKIHGLDLSAEQKWIHTPAVVYVFFN